MYLTFSKFDICNYYFRETKTIILFNVNDALETLQKNQNILDRLQNPDLNELKIMRKNAVSYYKRLTNF